MLVATLREGPCKQMRYRTCIPDSQQALIKLLMGVAVFATLIANCLILIVPFILKNGVNWIQFGIANSMFLPILLMIFPHARAVMKVGSIVEIKHLESAKRRKSLTLLGPLAGGYSLPECESVDPRYLVPID